jgi:hypothetical protein
LPSSVITEEAMKMIGTETGYGRPMKIERGALQKYAKSIKHPGYMLNSDVNSESDPLPMPLSFLLTNLESGIERDFDIPLLVNRRVRGGDTLEMIEPVYAGDTICANTKLVSLVEKQSKTGPMVLIETETLYKNQHDRIVLRGKTTIIKR